MNKNDAVMPELVPTGIAGLDEVLRGGLPRHHRYVVEGESGTGKTTLALQFLMEGARAGERVLLVTMTERSADLEEIARSHGWSLEGIDIYAFAAEKAVNEVESQQTVFPTAEVELSEMTEKLVEILRRQQPQRVAIDSVTEMRMLSHSRARFRRQMLALSHVVDEIGATALLLDRASVQGEDRVMDSLVHGILGLERSLAGYGEAKRRLEVRKLRGMEYQDEWHNFRIRRGGLELYPQPRSAGPAGEVTWEQLSSGKPRLDLLLGGGLELGSACLIGGSAGTGKSTIGNLFVYSALQKGMKAGIFIFDERVETLYKRSADLGFPLRAYVEQGQLRAERIETGEISPGEFGYLVRSLVEEGIRVLLIDSLTGYLRGVSGEEMVLKQMHDLLHYLSQRGVLSMLIVTHRGLVGENTSTVLDLSYLSDTVILLRHFEAAGKLRQAISVVKKRHSTHERTIRELRIEPGQVQVGEPLSAFRGVLSGVPVYEGDEWRLLAGSGPGDEGE